MPLANPKLIEPLTRIENAARRAMGAMFVADKTPPKDLALVRREVQEIKKTLYKLSRRLSLPAK